MGIRMNALIHLAHAHGARSWAYTSLTLWLYTTTTGSRVHTQIDS